MPKITYIQPDGDSREIDVAVGLTVMEGAIRNDVIGIEAECGGSCACATCHVHIVSPGIDEVGRPGELEQDMLDFAYGVADTSRLSCQIRVTEELDGLKVRIADQQ